MNSAVGNLEQIQRYSRLLDECSKQMGEMTEQNTRFIRSLGVPLRFDRRPPEPTGVLRRVARMVDDYQQRQRDDPLEKISILSPRLLSLLPDRNVRRPRLLSPSLFSFQADEPLSLPQLLTPALGRRETGEWMKTLLEVSGAAHLLEQTARRLGPLMHELETRIHPKLRQLDEWDRAFAEVGRKHSAEQRRRLESDGYAFMTAEQMQLIYENPLAPRLKDDAIVPFSDEEREGRLEADIRRLAALDEAAVERLQRRARRQTPDLSEPIIQAPEVNAQEYPIWEVLSPFGFGSRINEGIVLEALILSPHAFFAEIMQPESMNLALLSPRAFIPSVLSPDAMIARILSPAAFRAEILSPRTLIIQILSPNALAPKIYSPEFAGVLVLSPSIASPRFMSGEKLMVEVSGRRSAHNLLPFSVLSPQILGGSTESKSAEGGSKEEAGEKSAEAKGSKERHKSFMETKYSHEHSGHSTRNEADVPSADSKRVQPPH
ncbi:hypothetical protein M3Y99_00144200 [Aphelenchoides fujianensis]|nr:hypothetical protein M3Y99_00144200 [Aphelenchoides fujianensis]